MLHRKKYKTKVYSGYMKCPLHITESSEGGKVHCEFFGDLRDQKKLYQIFKRPRKYRVEVWLRVDHGYDVTEMTLPIDKVDKYQLSQLIYKLAVDEVEELAQRENVYIDESYFKIII